MMARLQAITSKGHTIAKFHSFKETDNGLILSDEKNQKVGYLPFDSFHRVVEIEDE